MVKLLKNFAGTAVQFALRRSWTCHMSGTWKKIDEENLEATVMPNENRYKKVCIMCNDCNDTTEVYFHIIGQKCSHCESYNTQTVAPPVLPQYTSFLLIQSLV